MFKIGHGYDLHKLVYKKPLILCGEKIPFFKGLLGHSDADVATHALIDSLLGAAGLGDIGQHFPDNDPQYKDICSLDLLSKVMQMILKDNLSICNIDITIIAQAPKLSPFMPKMKDNLKDILKIAPQKINIKATTEENLGVTKNNTAIACHSCCLLQENNS